MEKKTNKTLKEWCVENNRLDLLDEWDYDKNGELTPDDVSYGSGKKVWWKCSKGHEWQARVDSRNKRNGCPHCSGRTTIIGVNDLATTHPELVKEWHPTKNGDLKPTNVMAGSHKKVWWIGRCGHEWEALIRDKAKRLYGCPVCTGKRILVGFNDLATTHPELAKEWHPTKNGKLKPENVVSNGKKKVWWICKHGHEYEALIIHRKNGMGCPVCAGKRILVGFNDLATTHPEVAKEWHPTKNGKLKPTEVTSHSNKSAWWMCEHGHEWKTNIGNRTKFKNTNCPYCSSNGMSKPEITLLYYIKKYANCEIHHRYNDFGFELDIYIPSIKTAIEYDGVYYHKNRVKADFLKNELCKKLGIKLYRIRENGLSSLNDTSINFFYNPHNITEFETLINTIIITLFHKQINVDIKKDNAAINCLVSTTEKANSIMTTHPHLIAEWHPTKNKSLKPEHVTAGSNKKVWWMCKYGHEWEAVVSSRTIANRRCPYCSGQKVLVGFNDLATTHPEIAKQWHPTKNGDLKPTDVMAGSHKKVWWLCSNGHSFLQSISHRTILKQNCPTCARIKNTKNIK